MADGPTAAAAAAAARKIGAASGDGGGSLLFSPTGLREVLFYSNRVTLG